MLKLKRFKEGVWADFLEVPGVRVKVRPVPLGYQLELRSKLRKRVPIDVEPGKPPQFIEDVDEGALLWSVFSHTLEDWEGIEVEGNPTPEEIKKAIFDHDGLRQFIIDKSRELSQTEEKKIEEETKNLSSSQSGLEKNK